MKRIRERHGTEYEPAAAILVSASLLAQTATDLPAPQNAETARLVRDIQNHQELARQAVAEIVGRYYFQTTVAPLVEELMAWTNPRNRQNEKK